MTFPKANHIPESERTPLVRAADCCCSAAGETSISTVPLPSSPRICTLRYPPQKASRWYRCQKCPNTTMFSSATRLTGRSFGLSLSRDNRPNPWQTLVPVASQVPKHVSQSNDTPYLRKTSLSRLHLFDQPWRHREFRSQLVHSVSSNWIRRILQFNLEVTKPWNQKPELILGRISVFSWPLN